MSLLLKNANIWMANAIVRGNILIDSSSGCITRISRSSQASESSKHIDLKGCLVIPGAVDIHTHLRDFEESNKETFETGGRAAAAGGFTAVFDMPNKTRPVFTDKRLQEVLKKAKQVESVDIIPYVLLTAKTSRALLESYPYTKAYIGPTTGNCKTSPEDINRFVALSEGLLSVHCEDEQRININKKKFSASVEDHSFIRDPETETAAIKSLVEEVTDKISNVSIHVAHVTLPESINVIKRANMSFEVTPHHLFLNTGDYSRLHNNGRMNPPLRARQIQHELIELFLRKKIPIVATDHAPHTIEEKEQGISGVPGLETCIPLLFHHARPLSTQRINTIVNAVSINPRILTGLSSDGIKEGSKADLTVIDINRIKKVKGEDLQTKCRWSPWEGEELQGWPVMTIKEGKITFSDL
ncbi:MAG: dihydroorotase [Candidatus Hodarchaeales archaeon]